MADMALTSPSGPRAGSPPSAFSSAFCKTTKSRVNVHIKNTGQELIHGTPTHNFQLLSAVLTDSTSANVFHLCFSVLRQNTNGWYQQLVESHSKPNVIQAPHTRDLCGLHHQRPTELRTWALSRQKAESETFSRVCTEDKS